MKSQSLKLAVALSASLAVTPLCIMQGEGVAQAFPENPSQAGGYGNNAAPPPVDMVPLPLKGIEIVDKPGAVVPQGLHFRDHDGRDVTLGDVFSSGKPVVMVMAYYECPMLCSVVLNGLKTGLASLAWTPGKEFRVVTVSIDPRDTPAHAKNKRKVYLEAYGRPVHEHGWDFLVGLPRSDDGNAKLPGAPEPPLFSDDRNSVELAKTIGFGFRWDPKTNQYAHAAGAFIFTPEGKLSATLYGIQFSERNLRLALTEASQGKLGTAWDRVMLLCYHYDPNEHSYVLAGKRFMRAGGALTAFALVAFLARLWRRELRTPPSAPPSGPPHVAA